MGSVKNIRMAGALLLLLVPALVSSSPAGRGTSAMTGMPSQLSVGGTTITPTKTLLTSALGGAPIQVGPGLRGKPVKNAPLQIRTFPLYRWSLEFLVTATGQIRPILTLVPSTT